MVTEPIAWNAAAATVQAALQRLSNVGTVQVRRSFVDAALGTFTWLVSFDPQPGAADDGGMDGGGGGHGGTGAGA